MSSLASQNEHRYLLNAIYTLYKYASSASIRSKMCEAVASAMTGSSNRKPLVVGTHNVKEFVNARFRKILYGGGIKMRVCRSPNVECAIVECTEYKKGHSPNRPYSPSGQDGVNDETRGRHICQEARAERVAIAESHTTNPYTR